MQITNPKDCVELLDFMGDDLTVVNRARASLDVEHQELSLSDERLIRYLARSEPTHWAPFSHVIASFRITAPLFIARQWYRHHVGVSRGEDMEPGWSEVSRRYVRGEPEFYWFDQLRHSPTGGVKQGSGDALPSGQNLAALAVIRETFKQCASAYRILLEDFDVCPEQARAVLPTGTMVRWSETGSLWYWVRFLKHRTEGTAQKEIRDYAAVIEEHLRELFPISMHQAMEND